MGSRVLDIFLLSASSLTRRYPDFRMVVYARAYLTNDSRPVQCTLADWFGDVNPRWNHPLSFSLNCSSGGTTSTDQYLNIDLFNVPDGWSYPIGSLQIPLLRFLTGASHGATGYINDSWPVSTGGYLYFSYKLGAYDSQISRIGSTVRTFSTIGSLVHGTILIASLFGLDN